MCTGMTHYNRLDGWISARDRLPENGKMILCWYRYFGYAEDFGVGCYFNGAWIGSWPVDPDVLFWQPLPDPPKMEDTECL